MKKIFKKYKLRKLNKELAYANAMIRKWSVKNHYTYLKYTRIRDELIEEIKKVRII